MCVPSFPFICATPALLPCPAAGLYWREADIGCQHGNTAGRFLCTCTTKSVLKVGARTVPPTYSLIQPIPGWCSFARIIVPHHFILGKDAATQLPWTFAAQLLRTCSSVWQMSKPFFPRQDQRPHPSLSIGSQRWLRASAPRSLARRKGPARTGSSPSS